MATKFTDLTTLTSADPTDLIPINDVSASTDKKVPVSGLAAAVSTSFSNGSIASAVLSNPYKFSAYQSVAQNLVAGFTAAKIQLQSELFDTGSNFDSTTNYRFTAPVAGFYQFNAAFSIYDVNGTVIYASLFVNASEARRGNFNSNNSGGNQHYGSTVSALLKLNAGDYVELWGAQSNSSVAATDANAQQTYFDGHLVSVT